MSQLRFLKIEFVDGTTASYSFPVNSVTAEPQGKALTEIKLESFFKDRLLILHGEGKLMVFPVENIKSVQISSEDKELAGIQMPKHTIMGAERIT